MCAIDSGDYSDIWRAETRTARKPHWCEECARRIQPGETYRYITELYDGRWATFKQCRHCVALGAWMDVLCGGYPIAGLHEELIEHWREGYASLSVGRWIVAMQKRWHDGADPVPQGVSEAAQWVLSQVGGPS